MDPIDPELWTTDFDDTREQNLAALNRQQQLPRAITAEEIRQELIDTLRHVADYWSQQPNLSPREMCDGVVFNVLTILDGVNLNDLPAMDLVVATDAQTNAEQQEAGQNWHEPGMVITDGKHELHAMYHRSEERLGGLQLPVSKTRIVGLPPT